MDTFKLKRGNSIIELEKNENLMAFKSNGQDNLKSFLKAVAPEVNYEKGSHLAGFQLASVASSDMLEDTLDTLRQTSVINVGSHVYNTLESEAPYIPTGKITLRFNEGVGEEEQNNLLDKYKLEVLSSRTQPESDDDTRTYIVGVTPDSPNPLKVAAELQQMKIIKLAEPDLATPGRLAFQFPTDDLLPEQWHLLNTGVQFGTSLGLKAGADARVVKAWQKALSLGDRSCIISVIDDGFDLSHPDLSTTNKIVSARDFENRSADPAPKNFIPGTGDWHGTACAGVATGSSNGKGVVGAAPNCRLMPVRWGKYLSDASVEEWFGYVAREGAWIVSCSWGASDPRYVMSTLQREAIARCAKSGRNGLGCVIVFAAGNDGRPVSGFAIHPDVIAVAASNSRDERSDYSNYGEQISVCAPSNGSGGRGILTSDVTGQYDYNGFTYDSGYGPGDYTKTFGGTSSATPLVAGICALVLSADPALTSKQVKKIIEHTARQIGDKNTYTNGHSPYFGYGCIDAEAAVGYTLKVRGNLSAKKNKDKA